MNSAAANAPGISRSKLNLKKFGEDEILGDMATQAMPLYSNLNYPNLKNEITDLGERFKHVTKMWRKLDGPTKLIYVNKSRQNRYKKKSDEKMTNGTVKSKRAKSPTNSDKQSDIEQFSRSATPSISAPNESETSITLTNIDGTNQSNPQLNEKLRQSIANITSNNMNPTISSQILSLNNSSQYISQLSVVKNEQLVEEVKRVDQTQHVVNLNQNQPPKIIQLSNQIPVGLMNNSQKNQILLYQMQQKQQQTAGSIKQVDAIEQPNNEASQTPTSNIQLENCEFINSSKANLAKNLVNSNADLNSKPEAQCQDNKINNLISNNNNNNNNNMRVYLNQDGQIQHNQQQGNFISTENNAPIQLKLIQQGLIL